MCIYGRSVYMRICLLIYIYLSHFHLKIPFLSRNFSYFITLHHCSLPIPCLLIQPTYPPSPPSPGKTGSVNVKVTEKSFYRQLKQHSTVNTVNRSRK